MNSIFKESTINTITKIKKGFLWTAVCLLIGAFVIGAIMLLAQSWSVEMGKVLATMAILTLVLFVGVNNFIRMEKGNTPIQILALVGLISGLVAALLGILLVWEVMPLSVCEYTSGGYLPTLRTYNAYELCLPSVWVKICSVMTSIAAAGFWISNVMAIKNTTKVVMPLKITSIVCEAYCAIYAVIVVISGEMPANNLTALSGLAGFAFVVTALAAWIISKTTGKKENVASGKSEAELRSEIEEQVRREMIEKEVREKMDKEGKDN